jgi:hypothetical protein
MTTLANSLRELVATEGPRLRAISEDAARTRPGGAEGWSRKQELGHLLDSATNNRVRFVRGALEGGYDGPSYDGDGWVAMGGYSEARWSDLVDLWCALNVALAAVVDRVPPERLPAQCRVGGSQPVTLEFLIEDYMLHAKHHLDHIVERGKMTAYPGATMGV